MARLVLAFVNNPDGSTPSLQAQTSIIRDQKAKWAEVVVVISSLEKVNAMLLHAAKAAADGDDRTYREVSKKIRDIHNSALAVSVSNRVNFVEARREIERLISEFMRQCHFLQILNYASPWALDSIVALGELMSALVIASALCNDGIAAEAVDARDIIITNTDFGSATPLIPKTRLFTRARVGPLLQRQVLPVITGSIGATETGVTTSLGSEGIYYSATIIGAVMKADQIAIYTDVNNNVATRHACCA